jgi:hypothetical protein
MGIEKHNPTAEEMKSAENLMTPEQKLQSEAHEEGFKLGGERAEKTIYVGSINSVENKETPIKQNLTLEIYDMKKNGFILALNQACISLKVNCVVKDTPARNEYTKFFIELQGFSQDINKVLEHISRWV